MIRLGHEALPLILIVLGEFGGIEDDGELTVEDRETTSKNTRKLLLQPVYNKPKLCRGKSNRS